MLLLRLLRLLIVLVVFTLALIRAGRGLGSVCSIVLLSAPSAVHKFAVSARATADVPTERVAMAALREPTTQAGVFHIRALATVLVYTAVHGTFDFVDHVEERTKVAGREVVAHALENVQDLVIRDGAVVVFIGLLVERGKGLFE